VNQQQGTQADPVQVLHDLQQSISQLPTLIAQALKGGSSETYRHPFSGQFMSKEQHEDMPAWIKSSYQERLSGAANVSQGLSGTIPFMGRFAEGVKSGRQIREGLGKMIWPGKKKAAETEEKQRFEAPVPQPSVKQIFPAQSPQPPTVFPTGIAGPKMPSGKPGSGPSFPKPPPLQLKATASSWSPSKPLPPRAAGAAGGVHPKSSPTPERAASGEKSKEKDKTEGLLEKIVKTIEESWRKFDDMIVAIEDWSDNSNPAPSSTPKGGNAHVSDEKMQMAEDMKAVKVRERAAEIQRRADGGR
jgi:hypothetical protein